MGIQKITPHLWFNDQAEQAMRFYCDVFPDSEIKHIERYPDESLSEHFAGMSGKVISGLFVLAGQQFQCLDGGPLFTFNESISFMVSCADQAEIDYYWGKLSHVPESEQCGWCKDQFGVSWQIIPDTMGELLQTPTQVKAMMAMKKIVIADLQAAG